MSLHIFDAMITGYNMDLPEVDELLDGLCHWVRSLLVTNEKISPDDLLIGWPLAEALARIDGQFFDEAWIERVQRYDYDANWRVKANNLRKVHSRLGEYYTERLRRKLPDTWIFDAGLIAENNDRTLLFRLTQLVLGAAILGPHKDEFVQDMLGLEESIQKAVMLSYQALENDLIVEDETGSVQKMREQMNKLQQELDEERKKHNVTAKRCASLDKQLSMFDDDRIHSSPVKSSSIRGEKEPNPEMIAMESRLRDCQSQLEVFKEEQYKSETERLHLHEINAKLTEERDRLITKMSSFVNFEEDYRRMRDEVEEAKIKAEEYKKMEMALENYRHKLKDYNEKKQEVKVLGDKLENYVKSAVELEDEKRKTSSLRTQVEAFRLAALEKDTRLNDAIKRADRAEFELKNGREKLSALEEENDRLRRERNEAREIYHMNNIAPPSDDESTLAGLNLKAPSTSSSSSADLREKLARLAMENEKLREENSDQLKALEKDHLKALEKDLEAALSAKAELESELRIVNENLMEAQARKEEAEKQVSLEGLDTNERLTEQLTRTEHQSVRIAQLTAQLESVSQQAESSTKAFDALKIESASDHAKFKKYLEKARQVIADLEEQNKISVVDGNGTLSRHEFDGLRKENETKDRRIRELEERSDRYQMMHEQEQRLITTHFYSMAKSRLDDQMTAETSSNGRSMLSRQRQVNSIRPSSFSLVFFCLLIMALMLLVSSHLPHTSLSHLSPPPV